MNFTENTVICCDNEEESSKLLRFLQDLGYRWRSGDLPLEWRGAIVPGKRRYFVYPSSMRISYGCLGRGSEIPFSALEIEDETPRELVDFLASFEG